MADRKYVYIDVVDTAVLCGLDIKPGTIGNDEVQARCPYCQDYRYRMYLCRQPDNATFWCHNCGTGGNAVTLYADFNPGGRRLTTREAFWELMNEPQVQHGEPDEKRPESPPDPIRPLHERSRIYLEMLSLLELEPKHYENLRMRGLSDDMIRGNMYRSIPTDGNLRKRVTERLAKQYDLSGMPGFYTRDFHWQMAGWSSGILLPVCDVNNQIQGLQIRLDEPPTKIVTLSDGSLAEKQGNRFFWFSTGKMKNGKKVFDNGTGISCHIHVVGDPNSDTLHITEGPLKADIASFLSGGELFIGLTGVQNTKYLADVVAQLHPKRILECIDMDVRANPQVQRAQAKIRSICMPLCDDYRAFTWPVEQKGIDDFLLFEKLKREQLYRAA